MTLNEIVKRLAVPNDTGVTIGHNGKDTIYIYEHVHQLKKHRKRPDWIPPRIHVIYEYVGKITPL